jgi:hypothetical protein
MKRAEWLQETRKMRFEETYGGWQSRRLTQEEPARLLGVRERTFRRHINRRGRMHGRTDRPTAESGIASAGSGG